MVSLFFIKKRLRCFDNKQLISIVINNSDPIIYINYLWVKVFFFFFFFFFCVCFFNVMVFNATPFLFVQLFRKLNNTFYNNTDK